MPRTIGIDLGTTNSVVAFVQQDRVEAIVNSEGSKTTPSVVLFGEDEDIVGELAKRQMVTRPGQTIRSAKRLMGRRFEEIEAYAGELPFKAIAGEGGRAEIELEDGRIIPPELAGAKVLAKMRDTAEDFFGEEVDTAVITVPAHFNDAQRTATKKAAELAGLTVMRLVNEPTAAALAYGFGHDGSHKNVAVFDFGGGTFDISILSIDGDIFEVLSTNGDTNLGGDNLDQVVLQQLCDQVAEQTGIDPRADSQAIARLREAAEKVKIELSSLQSTHLSLPFLVSDASGPKHFEGEVTRIQFNEWCAGVFERLIPPCEQALADANLTVRQLQDVILVGGSTRIPRVQEMVREFFGKAPNRSVHPDEAVALGAAIQGGVMRGDLAELLLLDVTPLSLGIELAGGIFKALIERNSSIPCEATRKYTTVVDNQTNVAVHVLQGERAVAAENRTLAKFRLTGIPPMPKELAEIEVTFRIDADGILEVTAVDLTSGVSAGVQVEGYGELATVASAEVDKFLEEQRAHKAEDEAFLLSANRRAQADRIQDRVAKLIEIGGDVLTEIHLKTLKETMFRHDLAVAGHDWQAADRHEHVLQEILEEYDGMLDLHRALNRELVVEEMEEVPVQKQRAPRPAPQQAVEAPPAVGPPEAAYAPDSVAPEAAPQPAPQPPPQPAPDPRPKAEQKEYRPLASQENDALEVDEEWGDSLPPPPPPA